jgi:hypothetical protein
MKPSVVHGTILAVCCVIASTRLAGAAEDKGPEKGPENVVIQAVMDPEKVARPAYLPHQAHQWLECDGCHHGKGTGGKMVDYVAGQKIEKCETCHNSKAGMPERIATLKRASHMLCMECHLQQDKDLAKCGVCHTKK